MALPDVILLLAIGAVRGRERAILYAPRRASAIQAGWNPFGAKSAPTPPCPMESVQALVPLREQVGPSCSLYALGMIMDYWHAKDATNPTAHVLAGDASDRFQKRCNFDATTDDLVMDVAMSMGVTTRGEIWFWDNMAELATHFGYVAAIYDEGTMDDVYRALDAGHPVLLPYDASPARGERRPGNFGGKHAHAAVLQGYFDDEHGRWLVAKQSGGRPTAMLARGDEDFVWRAEEFDASWHQLRWSRAKKDWTLPSALQDRLLELGDVDMATGKVQFDVRSLYMGKAVEIVPRGMRPVGGRVVAPGRVPA